PSRHCCSAGPYRAFTILQELENVATGEFRVLRELAIFPACEALRRANPQSSVTRDQQAEDKVRGKLLAHRRLPEDIPHTIVAEQAEFRTQPEIAIGRLRD